MNTLRKTRFWAAIAVAALLLLGIAGLGNTNASTKNLEASGPQIDPFQMTLNAKNLPTQELDRSVYGTFPMMRGLQTRWKIFYRGGRK
jgi:hypothetical protein